MLKRGRRLKLALWLFLLGLILFFSLVDLRPYLHVFLKNQDKLFHLVIFALLIGLTKKLIPAFSLFQITTFIFSFGILIEVLQKLFTHGVRHFSFNDVLFNLMGIGFGLILLTLLQKFKAARPSV